MMKLVGALACALFGGAVGAATTVTSTSTVTFTSTFTQTLTQSAAAGGDGVFVTLLIEGVDYALLAARVTLRETMEMELKQAVASGQTFSQETVTVEMASGSLLITFKITAAGNTDFNTLAQQLRLARDAIAQRAAAILRTIPGIAAITVGTLTVRVCGLGLTRGAALTTCAGDIAPEPTGSMPANLNSAVRIGGVVAADGLLADFQGSAAQGPHPALMFGLGAATALALAVPLSKKWNSHAALASTDVE